MIEQALLHLAGIGPKRRDQLHARQVHSWADVLAAPETIPARYRPEALEECRRCERAREHHDIGYFVEQLAPQDRWRILSQYGEQASFFDIETAGLEADDPITLIICWHRGELHTFVEHENLDAFLDLLLDVRLLTSFNGSSFDVPRVLDTFHIPSLPCPHLDLRWLCFHHGLRGGLKEICYAQGIRRPPDLADVDGEVAIRLWARWHHFGDEQARADLIRYGAADVLLLVALAQRLVGESPPPDLWQALPATSAMAKRPESQREPTSGHAFGPASPDRLRGRRAC